MDSKLSSAAFSAKETSHRAIVADFLTPDRIVQISAALSQFMQDRQPFLSLGYNLRDLGADLGIPYYHLSAFINQWLGMNFNEYMNQFRIRYCQQSVKNGQADHLNLRGLAHHCGFSNRNTFTSAFKKYTGLTPSVYVKRAMIA
jgi:AraC-like DNA-binding protein